VKMPVTMGLTIEAIEQVLGFRIDKVVNARTSGNSVYIDLVINAEKEELTDERVH